MFKDGVVEICNVIKQQQQDSQSQVPCTQGQEWENLSSISHLSSPPQPRASTPKTSRADTGTKSVSVVSGQEASTSSDASTNPGTSNSSASKNSKSYSSHTSNSSLPKDVTPNFFSRLFQPDNFTPPSVEEETIDFETMIANEVEKYYQLGSRERERENIQKENEKGSFDVLAWWGKNWDLFPNLAVTVR